MVIISKNRIFKPKVLVNDLSLQEPSCFIEAFQNGNWKATMIEENEIFVKNKTQSLMPLPPNRKLVGCVGTFSHVYFHASIHMEIPQLNHMSLIPALFELPSKHLETFYPNHLGPLSKPHFPKSPESFLICKMMIIWHWNND